MSNEHGRIFKANSDGIYFTRQLDNTNYNSMQHVEWSTASGIEGVMLANQIVNMNAVSRGEVKKVRTLISFDDGDTWNTIPASMENQCISNEDCRLHFHSINDYHKHGLVSSNPSAIGLGMGIGSAGTHLLPLSRSHTYLSRDAGKSWIKVSGRPTLYEISDQGSIVVFAGLDTPTQHVSFSYDWGSTWHMALFSETPVLVRSIAYVPTVHNLKILVSGIMIDQDQRTIVSTMSFSEMRECFHNQLNPRESDLEKWSPLNGEKDRCILGREALCMLYGVVDITY
ncbi:vacuolar protein sorting/targeting protein PEP1 [Mortierella polycephala]|uniref:Vacuolar protein sorting/targeting protein PEP1 n=1 Tax=Mortierella polycephala TaxID=41804 RepID=A0A9P6Q4V7_9FUNG|nr:vacuolar protein sorting/targeting protein PEP1 [Mortierella polycephala]